MKRLTDIQTAALANIAKHADTSGRVDWDKIWAAGLVPANSTLVALERRGLVALTWTAYRCNTSRSGFYGREYTRHAITGATLIKKT